MKGEYFPIFRDDVEQWASVGLTSDEIDALVLALFRWWRGRPDGDTSALSVGARLLYHFLVNEWNRNQHTIKRPREKQQKQGRKTSVPL